MDMNRTKFKISHHMDTNRTKFKNSYHMDMNGTKFTNVHIIWIRYKRYRTAHEEF